tara:strand:+ start:3550 stop:3870 length:321 start_codon:yes stop_codon:yes gene_type:complete
LADVVDDVEKEEEVDAVVVVVVVVVLLLLLLLRMKPSLPYLTTLFEEEEEEEVVVVVVQVGVGAVRSIAFVSFSLFVEIQKKEDEEFLQKGEQKKKRTINQKKAKI